MSGRLYQDNTAEREANDIGRKYMSSTDVVGDMSRAYGTDLSSVRIHTDDDAARRVQSRGVDAFSTGKDIFFGKGIFDKNDPASRGLLAHELSHSIQQGIGEKGGMRYSVPMGAEQGGLISWFRNRKRRKAEAKQLDALDEKYSRWKRMGQEHLDDFMENGVPQNAAEPVGNSEEIDITELTASAKQKGWTHRDGRQFTDEMTENFFREISGKGVVKADNAVGNIKGNVYTGNRSMRDMMDAFNNHDEATTLRVLRPLMELDEQAFIEQYPFHKMNAQERRIAFP